MKKGFTLVELLAVIVILAIIALISIPLVGDTIEKSKVSAIENSVSFYVKEVESSFSEWVIEGIPTALSADKSESGYLKFNVISLNGFLKLDGSMPVGGIVKIDNSYSTSHYFGYVVSATLEYEDYVATYTYHTSESDYEKNSATIVVEKK